MQADSTATPLMRQYFSLKKQYHNMLLFFQVGDFYELFFEDAQQAAACLGIALTKRGNHNGDPIPLCGVPVHAVDHYVAKLIQAGFNVAMADQLEEAKPGKVVDRGIRQVLTPGTLVDEKLLNAKSASYLAAVVQVSEQWVLLVIELLTGTMHATCVAKDNEKQLESELSRFMPDEVVIASCGQSLASVIKRCGYRVTEYAQRDELQPAYEQWKIEYLANETKAQLAHHTALDSALWLLYQYVSHVNCSALEHIKTMQVYRSDDYLMIDPATQKNLELVSNAHDGTRAHSLLYILDHAATAMGSRMLKKWILRPLVKKDAIMHRLDAVELMVKEVAACQELEHLLSQVGDIERVVGRITLNRAPLHDYVMLMRSLPIVPRIKQLVSEKLSAPLCAQINSYMSDCSELHTLLARSLHDDSSKEWLIKEGFDQKLDDMRALVHSAHEKIMALEMQEQQSTGIPSLKIRYNNVQGYYIEVTKTHMHAIPARYVRMQTLAGRERYMTSELQQLQHEIQQARAQIELYEKELYEQVKAHVATQATLLRKTAHALAHLDALSSLAHVSYEQAYVRPTISEDRDISIIQGRHPVVEQGMGHTFIANDTNLTDQLSTWIITGPNMGGKSTYLRQVALICIMAQIGCFVSAKSASLPILDRIFTRIGAGDNLAQGKSTFLVEMEETATICTQATARSLVILDEVGRGTSTFDGLAIAQAVVEYVHTHIKARCLFATHYHELTLLPEQILGIVSYYAASRKAKDGIMFLYQIMPGVADGSFGVEVAKLAQLPQAIIVRSQEILKTLQLVEHQHMQGAYHAPSDDMHAASQEIQELKNRLQEKEQALHLLNEIDLDTLSPRQAFDLVWKMKSDARQ